MNNGKRFAIRIAALMLCLMTVSASLSSCGFFADSYLENNAWTEGKVTTKSENTRAETTATEEETEVEIIESPETTKTPDTTKAPETTKEPETTSAPETTLSPEQLDNIPDDVQKNVYLSHMNSGRCEMLIGKVNLTVIMVSDDVSVWNEAAIGELSSSLKLQEKQIEELAASYGKVLDITFSFLGSKIAGDAAAGGFINEFARPGGDEGTRLIAGKGDFCPDLFDIGDLFPELGTDLVISGHHDRRNTEITGNGGGHSAFAQVKFTVVDLPPGVGNDGTGCCAHGVHPDLEHTVDGFVKERHPLLA